MDLADELMVRGNTSGGRVALGLILSAPGAWVLRLRTVNRRQAAVGATFAGVAVVAVTIAAIIPANPAASAPFKIVSGAMEPALNVDQVVQVARVAPSTRISAGEILVFRPPNSAQLSCASGASNHYLVKRVIGLPGQTVSLSDGHVLINGTQLREPWLATSEQGVSYAGPTRSPYSLHHPYAVPADDYYVMGDNRTDSCDSRYWEFVPRSLLYGVVTSRREFHHGTRRIGGRKHDPISVERAGAERSVPCL